MSTTTIDATNIDGTETGVLVLADVKQEMQNAEDDMKLRPVNTEDETITGEWTYEETITCHPLGTFDIAWKYIHKAIQGGATVEHEMELTSASSNRYTVFAASTDGSQDATKDLKFDHDDLHWQIGDNRVLDETDASKYVGQNLQSGTTYTLVLADAGKMVEMNNAATNDLTVPPNSTVAFPVDTRIDVSQGGAGLTSIVAGGGVTIRTLDGLDSQGQYAGMSLWKRATDEWVLYGGVA